MPGDGRAIGSLSGRGRSAGRDGRRCDLSLCAAPRLVAYPKDCSRNSATLTKVPWLLGSGDPLGGLLPLPTPTIPESQLVAETTADIVLVSSVPEPER